MAYGLERILHRNLAIFNTFFRFNRATHTHTLKTSLILHEKNAKIVYEHSCLLMRLCVFFLSYLHTITIEWLAIETNESNCDRYIASNCIEIDQMKPTTLRGL